jgi:hypothetical protein
MDLTDNLEEQRTIITQTEDSTYKRSPPSEVLGRLIELQQALDEWITAGGALPDQWIS